MFSLFTHLKNLIHPNNDAPQAQDSNSPPEFAPVMPDTTPTSQPETVLSSLQDLNLQQAINAHRAWYDDLDTALRNKSHENYADHYINNKEACPLHMWLTQHHEQLQQHSEYAVLRDIHSSFHRCIQEILSQHQKGHFAEAILLLRRDLPVLSEEVQRALHNLYQQIEQNTPQS